MSVEKFLKLTILTLVYHAVGRESSWIWFESAIFSGSNLQIIFI